MRAFKTYSLRNFQIYNIVNYSHHFVHWCGGGLVTTFMSLGTLPPHEHIILDILNESEIFHN